VTPGERLDSAFENDVVEATVVPATPDTVTEPVALAQFPEVKELVE